MNSRQEKVSRILSKEVGMRKSEKIEDIFSKYVKVKNNRYCLSISEDDCLKMSIFPFDYRNVVVDLGKTNRLVAESEKFKGQRIELGKSQNIFFSNGISGHISVSDMNAVKREIFIPAGYKKIRFFSCVPKSMPYTIITCGISVLGGAFTLDSLHSTKFWVRSTEIALKSNNCNAELYFHVGDQYGGFGSWELIK